MKIGNVLLFILFGGFAATLLACVWMLPEAFHLREIGLFTALVMLILSAALVRGGSAGKSS